MKQESPATSYLCLCDHAGPSSSADQLSSHIGGRAEAYKGTYRRRVIDYLQEQDFETSLAKLRHEEWKRKHSYSLWQQEKNVLSIFSEGMFMQKVNYIHLNPVRAEMVERAVDYRWSSARIWQRRELEDEPLIVDCDRIDWRRA